ncbi:hypothetical protein D3C76_1146270 [compost metagenome]
MQARYEVRHLADGAQTDTAEFHRCTWLQAANRIFKEHQIIDVVGIKRILNTFLIVKQSERGFRRNRLTQFHPFRYIKAHPAAKQRGQ